MSTHDVWGDSDDEAAGAAGQQSLEREWQSRREEHYSSGYREGLEAGKHEAVQEGFDAGYAQGAAAGFSCGAARGAEVALRALAPRLPDVAAKLQDARQQQTAQQPGAAGNEGSPTQQLAAMPYQQLQRRVCEALMASPAQPACTPASASTGEPGPRPAALPDDVASALQASCNTMQLLGLQALPARGR